MPKKLGKSSIGIRAQEFHEGLKDVVNLPQKDLYLQKTILVGKAATLATHLKGLDYVSDSQALVGLASQLGIGFLELWPVLRELEEIDFAKVIETSSEIKRVELKIPELRSGYEELGERWLQLQPSELEQASVSILEEVAVFPKSESEMRNTLGLSHKDFNLILDIGKSGLLIEQFNDEGFNVLYSPLTVEERPNVLLTLTRLFPENQIVKALKSVQMYQGLPIERLTGMDKELAAQAIRLGALCPVQITSGTPGRIFVFTPRGGLRKEERVILEKARAILACVRFGEHYAQGRKILYPLRILEALRDTRRFRYSRPDFPEQYGLLVTQQIGRIEPDRSRPGFYNFSLIDTPENLQAINIAIDFLKIGLSPTSRFEVDPTTLLDISGRFSGTLPTRTKIGREVTITKETAREYLLRITKLAAGVDE